MEFENKIKIIERFDGYFAGINNKGAFILAINTFVISGFIIGIKDILSLMQGCQLYYTKILIALIIALSIISMIITILAILPYLDSSISSIWFFNDIANRSKNRYLDEISTYDEYNNNDIDEQIYYLAQGLKKKHFKIKLALISNIIQMPLIGILTYLILY